MNEMNLTQGKKSFLIFFASYCLFLHNYKLMFSWLLICKLWSSMKLLYIKWSPVVVERPRVRRGVAIYMGKNSFLSLLLWSNLIYVCYCKYWSISLIEEFFFPLYDNFSKIFQLFPPGKFEVYCFKSPKVYKRKLGIKLLISSSTGTYEGQFHVGWKSLTCQPWRRQPLQNVPLRPSLRLATLSSVIYKIQSHPMPKRKWADNTDPYLLNGLICERANPVFWWLRERARWTHLVLRRSHNNTRKSSLLGHIIHPLLTKLLRSRRILASFNFSWNPSILIKKD